MTDKPEKIIDASTVDRNLAIEGDIVIVGTGAGGATAAEILARAGLRVVMVEEGRFFTARSFTMHESQAYPHLYREAAGRKTLDKAISILQGRVVGGSTVVNWTTSFRTPEKTLQHWARQYGLQELTAATMAPWFERMERRLNIHPWTEVDPNRNNDALLRGARALGWHAALVERNVRNCQDLGYCGLGCPVDAKQSMHLTTVPGALAAGAVLVTRARAQNLEWQGDTVTAVHCLALDTPGLRPTGVKVRISAPHVIVAAGGIDGPALLLRSKVPDPNALIGKRTFLHLVDVSTALMPEEVEGYQGAPQSIYSDQFLWPDGVTGRCGFKLEVPPIYPAISMAAAKTHGADSAIVAKNFRRIHSQLALMRDGFHPESPGGTVQLREDGSPVLDYAITDYLRDGLRRGYLAMAEAQFAAGAVRVFPLHHDTPAGGFGNWRQAKAGIEDFVLEPLRMTLFSAHVMGGCAMGPDASSSVVGVDGRHHHLTNLTVCDGSLFPTSVGANPQLSIYGFAARIASGLAGRLGGSQTA